MMSIARLAPESYGFCSGPSIASFNRHLGDASRRSLRSRVSRRRQSARFGIRPADEIAVIHDGYEHVLEWKADRSALDDGTCPTLSYCWSGAKPHTRMLPSSIRSRRTSPPEASTSWSLAGRTPMCMRAQHSGQLSAKRKAPR